MKIGKFIINKFIPFIVWIAGAKKGSWEEKKYIPGWKHKCEEEYRRWKKEDYE